jgi:predicted nucleic acid-binding protein
LGPPRWEHEHYGLTELLSEDYQHDRSYGTVQVVNPFAGA